MTPIIAERIGTICPYDEGTEDYFRWHIGWDDAAFEFSYYAYDDDEE